MELDTPRLVTHPRKLRGGEIVADEKIKLTTTEARGGSGGTSVRSLMIVSVVLVIVAFVAIYLYYR